LIGTFVDDPFLRIDDDAVYANRADVEADEKVVPENALTLMRRHHEHPPLDCDSRSLKPR